LQARIIRIPVREIWKIENAEESIELMKRQKSDLSNENNSHDKNIKERAIQD